MGQRGIGDVAFRFSDSVVHGYSFSSFMRRFWIALTLALVAACSGRNDNAHTTASRIVEPPKLQTLTVTDRPGWIKNLLTKSADANPTVKIISPQPNQVIESDVVPIQLEVSGLMTTYSFAAEGSVGVVTSSDHVHIVLDNDPYEEYSDLTKPFELRKVAPGPHTLRVFAVRPWHEAYKNYGAMQLITFKLGSKDGNEGKNPDLAQPILTYNTPTGEFGRESDPIKLIVQHNLGGDAQNSPDPIMIDFWLLNAKLKGDGGNYRIRYFVDDDDERFIDKWEPIWLKGWEPGDHTVRLELLGPDQYPIKNGGPCIVTRDIKITQ